MNELLISQNLRMETSDTSSNNILRLLLIIVGLFVGIFIVREGNAQELEQTLLWKVEGKGIKPSYIYGTFHLLAQKDFEMKKKVVDAFNDSDQVVLELDMDDPNMQMKVMQNASMKDGMTLDELLSEEEYEMIDRVLTSTLGTGIENYANLKPVVLSSLLLPTLLDGLPASYEATFVQMATDTDKEVLGLESVKEQMQIFDKVPYEDQVADIMEIINEREQMKALFTQMVEIYKQEDVKQMHTMISSYMDGEREFDYLLVERNKNWIGRIGDLSKDKKTFFGVGAGHIGGEDGVVNLLMKAGYTVTPVFD